MWHTVGFAQTLVSRTFKCLQVKIKGLWLKYKDVFGNEVLPAASDLVTREGGLDGDLCSEKGAAQARRGSEEESCEQASLVLAE